MRVTPEETPGPPQGLEGGWIGDEETEAVINHVYNDFGYLLDPIRPLPTASA